MAPPTVPDSGKSTLVQHCIDRDGEESALLAGCLATPEDDAPRLVYADWIQEHGHEEVADHIRIACGFWKAEHVGEYRRRASARAAFVFWRERFDSLQVKCLLSIPKIQNRPDCEREIPKCWSYRREFVRGLPTRVIIKGSRLETMFHTGQEGYPLWLASEIWVPCRHSRYPSKIHIGFAQGYGLRGQTAKLARSIEEFFAQSSLLQPQTQVEVVR